MSDDEKKTPPFPYVVTGGKDATVSAPPRVGPTMAQIAESLADIRKRQQQLGLMVDAFIGGLNRRFDVLHEEAALLRVSVTQPANDREEPISLTRRTTGERAKRALVLTGKLATYGTTAAVVLRLVGKGFPEYQEAIDAVLGVFGL